MCNPIRTRSNLLFGHATAAKTSLHFDCRRDRITSGSEGDSERVPSCREDIAAVTLDRRTNNRIMKA